MTDRDVAGPLAFYKEARSAGDFEKGIEGESWKPRFDRYVAAFEPVLGHQDGPPDGYHDPEG